MRRIISSLLLLISFTVSSQGFNERDSTFTDTVKNIQFNYKQLIIPGILLGYGFWGIESGQIKSFNFQIRNEITENIDKKVTVDDFSRYVPAVSVYALNAFGVKGKNNIKDRSVILATSTIFTLGSVMALKSITNIERPDGTTKNSFPSGHAAIAFAGAEFLYQEYKDQSVWYGVAGYAIAAGTGLFRMYNNRHWLTDVAAGAGIGILSTKAAYWLNPYVTRKIFGEKERKSTSFLMPSYDGRKFRIAFVKSF